MNKLRLISVNNFS